MRPLKIFNRINILRLQKRVMKGDFGFNTILLKGLRASLIKFLVGLREKNYTFGLVARTKTDKRDQCLRASQWKMINRRHILI